MTTALHPCPSCSRHIWTSETVCPFCSAAVSGRLSAPVRSTAGGRLSRAALLAASTLVASPLACGGSTDSDEEGGSGGQGSDSGGAQGSGASQGSGGDDNMAPVYGAPAVGGDAQGGGEGSGGDTQGTGGDLGSGGDDQGSGGELVGPVYGLPPS